jgi:Replication-relaxation
MPPDTLALTPIRAKHRPRFRRASQEERPAFRLTARDRELLKVIYEYRFITACMLQDLVPAVALTENQQRALDKLIASKKEKAATARSAPTERPHRARWEILRRLQMLFHSGYLQRHKVSDSDPIAHALGNLGAEELTLYFGIDRKDIEWTTKNRESSERYIRHSLMVSRFRHALELSLREVPGAAVEFWKPGGAFKAAVKYEDTVSTREGTLTQVVDGVVIPDGLFVLKVGDKRIHYYLEADRSTMSNARYLSKLKSYFAFWSTAVRGGKHASGITQMRVLTVTMSEARKDNLRATAREVDPEGRAPNLFWFACERSYRDTPEQVISPIWQTLQDETLKSL